MTSYLIRRLLLIIPTLFGIIAINFVVVQFAPGGPVEQMVAELKGRGGGVTDRMTGGSVETTPMPSGDNSRYRGGRGWTRTCWPTSGACSASTSPHPSDSC